MTFVTSIAVIGTFDSKPAEHLFLKKVIEDQGSKAITINIGTKRPCPFAPDHDLFSEITQIKQASLKDRDAAIQAVLERGKILVKDLYQTSQIHGIISAGGGTGTYLATNIMRVLPLGFPKVMVSTVASRDLHETIGTKDITIMHSVVDLLGVNSISGKILHEAGLAVVAMTQSQWSPEYTKSRIALTLFGFITKAAEQAKQLLENKGYEVIPFHANGTGGMAMEELARDGYFDGILDLATHELADELKKGYCSGIGPQRLEPPEPRQIPRLVVPGGLDCAVLEFSRDNVPEEFRGRKIFFYDFRSAVRLDRQETLFLACQVAEKLNKSPSTVKILIPTKGWSEADHENGPLYDPGMRDVFIHELKEKLNPEIQVTIVDAHINDRYFCQKVADTMDKMVKESSA